MPENERYENNPFNSPMTTPPRRPPFKPLAPSPQQEIPFGGGRGMEGAPPSAPGRPLVPPEDFPQVFPNTDNPFAENYDPPPQSHDRYGPNFVPELPAPQTRAMAKSRPPVPQDYPGNNPELYQDLTEAFNSEDGYWGTELPTLPPGPPGNNPIIGGPTPDPRLPQRPGRLPASPDPFDHPPVIGKAPAAPVPPPVPDPRWDNIGELIRKMEDQRTPLDVDPRLPQRPGRLPINPFGGGR